MYSIEELPETNRNWLICRVVARVATRCIQVALTSVIRVFSEGNGNHINLKLHRDCINDTNFDLNWLLSVLYRAENQVVFGLDRSSIRNCSWTRTRAQIDVSLLAWSDFDFARRDKGRNFELFQLKFDRPCSFTGVYRPKCDWNIDLCPAR